MGLKAGGIFSGALFRKSAKCTPEELASSSTANYLRTEYSTGNMAKKLESREKLLKARDIKHPRKAAYEGLLAELEDHKREVKKNPAAKTQLKSTIQQLKAAKNSFGPPAVPPKDTWEPSSDSFGPAHSPSQDTRVPSRVFRKDGEPINFSLPSRLWKETRDTPPPGYLKALPPDPQEPG